LPGEFLANGGILRREKAKVYPEKGFFKVISSDTNKKSEVSAKNQTKRDNETD